MELPVQNSLRVTPYIWADSIMNIPIRGLGAASTYKGLNALSPQQKNLRTASGPQNGKLWQVTTVSD